MAQVTYRGNLSARSFPFLSQNWGRTVIVGQYDNNFNRQVVSSDDNDKDIGIPQVFYMHNVMPHQQGFQSIGYVQVQESLPADEFAYITFLTRDSVGNIVYLMVTYAGKVYKSIAGSWIYVRTFPNTNITVAYVSGTTYVYVARVGCYVYSFGLGDFQLITLTALDPIQTLGITGSAGYLIAWNRTTIAWSSTVDPTDFTPSLISGAGSGSPEGARGNITCCVPHILGFITYTEENAVASLYSGNSRYPFNFREIVNSGGLSALNQVTYDANSGNHYAYTTSGLQLISTSQTQTIFTSATDFIAGKLFEDYNENTDTFYQVTLTDTLQKAISMVSDRYLVISYGIGYFTHALVYDLTDKRWGKLKIDHSQCFEYKLAVPQVTEIPRQSIAFLGRDGSVKIVDFSVTATTSNGVIAFGKYQFVRPRLLQLDEIALENITTGGNFLLYNNVALDGKNVARSNPVLDQNSAGLFRRYFTRDVGINHSLIMRGAFSLVSLVLTFNIDAKR